MDKTEQATCEGEWVAEQDQRGKRKLFFCLNMKQKYMITGKAQWVLNRKGEPYWRGEFELGLPVKDLRN